jgi:hypothetical protein
MKKALLVAVLSSVVLVSCPIGMPRSDSLGLLQLRISASSMAAKTILPPLVMDVASYAVSGDGPASASFSQTGLTGASVIQSSLVAGPWTITVDAFNAVHELIGSGSVAVSIEAGLTTQASVEVTSLEGAGTLTIDLSWVSGLFPILPSMVGVLTPVGGDGRNCVFTAGENSLSYTSGKTLSAGYYSLEMQLIDQAVVTWGCFESVRILKDQTTSAIFNLMAEDINTGGIELLITPSLQGPITVTISGQQAALPQGAEMTATATTSDDPVDSCQWYLNGKSLAGKTYPSITLGSDLVEGNYRLDFGARKGNILVSASTRFSVLAARVSIVGVEEGDYYKSTVSPSWEDPVGTVSEPELLKDGIQIMGYAKGSALSENGTYTLSVFSRPILGSRSVSSVVHFVIDTTSPTTVISTNVDRTGVRLEVDFRKGSSFDSGGKPLYALWVEDLSGNFIQNLFITDTPATNIMRYTLDWVARPQALPYWAHKCCALDPYKDHPLYNSAGLYLSFPKVDGGPIPSDLDAVSGATEYVDFLVSTRRGSDGARKFRILFEINRSFDSNEYYTAGLSNDVYYDGSQPSLVYGTVVDLDTSKNDYTMKLMGAGHYAGRDGNLHTAEHHSTALDLVSRVVVSVKK